MHGLLETLERHARENPDRLAYLWLDDGEREGQRLTYGQLLMRVRVWSGAIARSAQPGDRALLQFPDGLEVLCALLGCFHAGVIAVPAPLPHHRLGRSALDKIVEDCTPALTLSPNTELGEEARVRRHHDIGYLQYTSGSTSAPRGVKISHRNVACNVEMMRQAWELPQDGAPMVSWLPIFHDMGLVAKALLALWSGVPCVFMAPTAFLAKPMRWLRAIHRYGAQLSGSPNFGFELCVKKSTPQEREELDLSSWRVAFNGAEPVRASTLDKFSQAFAISGFRPSALYSAYGLAEATVFVGTSRPNRVQVDLEGLGRHQVVPGSHTLVSTGMDPEVRVVDPESHQLCAPDQVGEVWVRGEHVSDGYWNRTEGPFGARLQPDGPADYLRTGDLAFYKDGELFITGRLKDLVILRGRNHYPQDLELCAEESHPQVRPGCTAAFSLEIEGEERLGMVAEVAGPDDLSAAIAAIRSRLSLEHGVELARLELIPRGTLPKTSSGKVQRSRTRAMMLAGEFRPLASWSLAPTAEPDRGTNPLAEGSLEGWLRAHLGGRLEKDRPLAEHGIDSLRAVELVEGLAQFSLRRLEPHQLWQFSTVADLLAWLGGDDTVTLPVSVGSSEDEAWLREPIAVIGLGCRFAGAGNVEEYWELLRQGRDGLAESPGGKIPGRDLFDARFFRIGPAEARSMDPQQRVLLETVWHALEHAHLPAQQLRGSNTGVFLGLSSHDYGRLLQGAGVLDAWSGLGNAASVAAGRISYALGLHGPSLAVDTACSSSLLAVHLACQSLRTGECDLALAGGVNLILSPDSDEELSRLGALSPNGRCRAFSADADGYARAEGCGVVVLQRLSQAVAAGHQVLAVISASAANQDGRSNGLTAPHGPAQQAVLASALARAGWKPSEVDYLEAHGTGTPLGDPIEVEAAARVYGAERTTPLLMGSVKSNIGHAEAAAGVAGLIKVVLSLSHGILPGMLHCHTPTPRVPWGSLPIELVRQELVWEGRRAGVSSFGLSGTNVHVLLERAPQRPRTVGSASAMHLLPLSAPDPAACRRVAESYARALPGQALETVCRAAGAGRSHFSQRAALLAGGAEQALEKLRQISFSNCQGPPRVGFLFTGQGSQYEGMGQELYESQPLVREILDRCHAIEPVLGLSAQQLAQTRHAQPALFALEVALAELWRSWGIEPAVMLGHSLGEIAAACVAGVFSLEDGMRLVSARGRLMQALPEAGAMVSLSLSEEEARQAMADLPGLSLAANNGPNSQVVSGPEQSIALLLQRCQGKRLEVSHAFHSSLMDPMLDEFEAVVAGLNLQLPQLPLISNLSGRPVGPEIATAQYWRRHVRETVAFRSGVSHLEDCSVLLEIGAHPQLLPLVEDCLADSSERRLLASLSRHKGDWETLLTGLGQLYTAGAEVAWRAVHTPYEPGSGAPLYPFEPTPTWFEPQLPGHRLPLAGGEEIVYQIAVDSRTFPELLDHRIEDRTVVPATFFLEMVRQAALREYSWSAVCLRSVVFREMLILEQDTVLLQMRLRPEEFEIHSQVGAGWRLHVSGQLAAGKLEVSAAPPRPPALDESPTWYQDWAVLGLQYGLRFQGLREAWKGEGEAVARVEAEGPVAVLDASLQTALLAAPRDALELPFSVRSVTLAEAIPSRVQVRALRRGQHLSDLWVWDERGIPVAVLQGLESRPGARSNSDPWLYAPHWVEATSSAGPSGRWRVLGPGGQDSTLGEGAPVGTLCLWGLEEGQNTAQLLGRVSELARSLEGGPLWLVSRGCQRVLPEDAVLEPAARGQAPLWGWARSIAMERPELALKLIDLDPEEALGSALRDEIARVDEKEPQIARRGGARYKLRLRRCALPAEPAPELSPEGIYLVTGGLGALGRLVAQRLRASGAGRVVLCGRRHPSAEEQAWLAGHKLEWRRLDLADPAQVRGLAEELGQGLRGLVHAAAVLEDALLEELTPEHFARVLDAKLEGAWNLHHAFPQPLDFFILFSSAAGLLGNAGQANYAAANTGLDALVEHRQSRGLSALSLQWGPWAHGLAARMADPARQRLLAQGWSLLEAEAGLRRLMALRAEQGERAVLPWNLRAAPRLALLEELQEPLEPTGREKLSLADRVRAEVARLLGVPRPDPRKPLRDMGLDSLMTLELRNRLSEISGQRLPATLAFEYPTIEKLVEFLERGRASLEPETLAAVRADNEPIAVVGLGCRFPGGVVDADSFWKLLVDEVDAISEVPAERWDVDAIYTTEACVPGKSITRWGGFVDDIDQFDSGFFGVPSGEADVMDPQQRLVLEVAWEALESGSLIPPSRTGVYVGWMGEDYTRLTQGDDLRRFDAWSGLGRLASVVSGRLSYMLGLHGPSITVDTACSSSLVAIHLASLALRTGECEMALAGGVSINLSPRNDIAFSQVRGMAADGRCKTFSAEADGAVWSEGCGIVALKLLSRAQADGDRVLAVLPASAVNQDGRSNGLSAPNGVAQEAVLRQALARCGVDPEAVDYVETHGTGTPLGDPIEVMALAQVHQDRPADRPLVLSSVKTNIGHAMSASGVAGLIKTILCLNRETIPTTLHCANLSTHVPWDSIPITVARQPLPWPRGERPRLAGVSSFGISGTNAHVMVREAPLESEPPPPQPLVRPYVLPLSARDPQALLTLARRWADDFPQAPLTDVISTASLRRSHHDYRLAVVGETVEELCQALRQATPGTPRAAEGLVFVFSGQGSQWVGMGRELLEQEPVFGQALQECDAAIQAEAGWSVIEELKAEGLSRASRLQPALFSIQMALAALWRSWGVQPDLVVGHSMGEVAAATVAGALSLADAVRVVCRRSQLMERMSGKGAMAVVELSWEEADRLLEDEPLLTVAVSNSARTSVVAGDKEALDRWLSGLQVFFRKVKVDLASHSPQMDPLEDELRAALAELQPRQGEIPILSTVTLQRLEGPEMDAAYWWGNLRQPVRFGAAVESLRGYRFLEVSPHPVLLADLPPGSVPSLRREQPEQLSLLASLGELYSGGYSVDWSRLVERRPVVSLPAYPWQHQRHWVRSLPRKKASSNEGLLGDPLSLAGLPDLKVWQTYLSSTVLPWLEDHKVEGAVLLPGASYLEMALQAAPGLSLEAVSFREPMLFTHEDRQVQVLRQGSSFQVSSRGAETEEWVLHCTGNLAQAESYTLGEGLAEAMARCTEEMNGVELYAELTESGLEYGPTFQGLRSLRRGDGEVVARITGTGTREFSPMLDACFQSLFALAQGGGGPAVPVEVAALRMLRPWPEEVLCHARARKLADGGVKANLRIYDFAGELVMEVLGLRCQRLSALAQVYVAQEWELSEAAPRPADRPGGWLLAGRYEELRQRLQTRGQTVLESLDSPCRAVVYMGGQGDPAEQGAEVVELVRQINATGWREKPRLYLVCPAGDLDSSGLIGLGRTVAMEQSELRCTRLVWEGDLEILLAELESDAPEEELALRSSGRWVARLQRRSPQGSRSLRIDPQGSYLITGGLGALGLAAARWLSDQGAGQILLLGRSGRGRVDLPGAEVVAADVSDRDSLSRALARCQGPLRGVIHAAGILDDALLGQQNLEKMRSVMAAKVVGSWNLHELTLEEPLDFFVMYSSAAALLGSPGQANYAAANAYQDALAWRRRDLGLPGLSLNWGAFAEGGLAGEQAQRLASRGVGAMRIEESLDYLERVLASQETQLGIVQLDFRHWLEYYPQTAGLSRFARLLPNTARRTLVDLRDRAAVEVYVLEQIRQLMRAATPVSPSTPFQNLGLDSLTGLELRNRLEAGLGLTLPATMIWSHPNVASLIDTLHAEAERAAAAAAAEAEAEIEQEPEPEPEPAATSTEPPRPQPVEPSEPANLSLAPGPWQSRRQLVEGLELFSWGEGPVLLLVPPVSYGVEIWRKQVETLSPHFRVLSLHYPGYGASAPRDDLSPPQIAQAVGRALAALGIPEFHLVGWSLGGLIAQELARQTGAGVLSLTLVCTTARLPREGFPRPEPLDAPLMDAMVSLDLLDAAARWDGRPALPQLRAPALVVQGARDLLFPPNHGQALAQGIPEARYVEIEEGDHFVPLKLPESFHQHLLPFLSSSKREAFTK